MKTSNISWKSRTGQPAPFSICNRDETALRHLAQSRNISRKHNFCEIQDVSMRRELAEHRVPLLRDSWQAVHESDGDG